MKSLDELLECLRERFDDGTDPHFWGVYIDMIKSAAAREREAVSDCNHTGNAAAMREALVAALPIMRNCPFAYYNTTDVDAVVAMMERALSAPPRQCDVGTAEEQYQRWVHFCEQRLHSCHDCECKSPVGCTFKFGDTPYAAEEGAGV